MYRISLLRPSQNHLIQLLISTPKACFSSLFWVNLPTKKLCEQISIPSFIQSEDQTPHFSSRSAVTDAINRVILTWYTDSNLYMMMAPIVGCYYSSTSFYQDISILVIGNVSESSHSPPKFSSEREIISKSPPCHPSSASSTLLSSQ